MFFFEQRSFAKPIGKIPCLLTSNSNPKNLATSHSSPACCERSPGKEVDLFGKKSVHVSSDFLSIKKKLISDAEALVWGAPALSFLLMCEQRWSIFYKITAMRMIIIHPKNHILIRLDIHHRFWWLQTFGTSQVVSKGGKGERVTRSQRVAGDQFITQRHGPPNPFKPRLHFVAHSSGLEEALSYKMTWGRVPESPRQATNNTFWPTALWPLQSTWTLKRTMTMLAGKENSTKCTSM